MEGLITALNVRSGTAKNGKTWKLYELTVNNIRMSTFDTTLGEEAVSIKKDNATVHLKYENDGKGNKIKDLIRVTQVEDPSEVVHE